MTASQATDLTQEAPRGASAPAAPENAKSALVDSAETLQLPLVIAQWEKNNREAFRVSLVEYKGKALVDCRIFYQADDGDYRPSPKGLSAALNHLPALADAMAKALTKAKANGLLQKGGET